MTSAFDFVYSCISSTVAWLNSISFLNLSLALWLICLAIVGIILDRLF